MRVLLDTNVLVRAHARARDPARELLGVITSGPHVLVASPFLLAEVVRVLNYPRLQALWGLTPDEIQDFVEHDEKGDANHSPTGDVVRNDSRPNAVKIRSWRGRLQGGEAFGA